jgi:hypothetical protein
MHRLLVLALAVGALSSAFVIPASAATSAPPGSESAWAAQMRQRVFAMRFPGSTISGASRTVTPIQRVAGVRRSAGTSTLPAAAKSGLGAKAGAAVRGVGNAASALFVLDLSYKAFSGGFGSGFGFSGLTGYESAGLLCDLTRVVDADTMCGLVPVEGYEPNSDLTGTGKPEGWAKAPVYSWSEPNANGAWQGIVQLAVQSTTPFDQQFGSNARVAVDFTGMLEAVCRNPYQSSDPDGVGLSATMFVREGTGATRGVGLYPPEGYQALPWRFDANCHLRPQTPPTRNLVLTSDANVNLGGSRFDHLEFTVRAAGLDTQRFAWYPPGHALWTPADEEDPERWWVTEWTCTDGSSGSQASDHFRETDEQWEVPAEPNCASSALASTKVWEYGGPEPSLLYEWTAPAELDAWAQAYPECTTGSCLLELSRVDAETGARLACFDNPALCADWYTDPQKQTNYVCTYGTHDVALDECTVYRPTFNWSKAAQGVDFADPLTGTEPDPTGAPPVGGGTEIGECPPPFKWNSLFNAWWYYQGVKCAGYDLFHPTTSPATQFASVQQTWTDSAPGRMQLALAEGFDGWKVAEVGCSGPPFTLPPILGGGTLYPWSTCSGWAAEWAPHIRTLAKWAIGIAITFSCLNSLGRGFGYDMGPTPDDDKGKK